MMKTLFKLLWRGWLGSNQGNFAVTTALALPILIGIAGGAIDFSVYINQQQRLQDAADGAALAAVKEASLEGWSQSTAQAVAENFVRATLRSIGTGSAEYTVDVTVEKTYRRVTVTVDQDHYGFFVAGYFRHDPQIRVAAAAQASGSTNICVIGLDGSDDGTIGLEDGARITAPTCAVYSNSVDPRGLNSLHDARLTAMLACSAGGYSGAPKNFNKLPLTDCPEIADPLATRLPPATKACPLLSVGKILEGLPVMVVEQGTHCGGLTIKGFTKAIFAPGIHIFKNGPLVVTDNATVDGLGGVGLYFTGEKAYFDFTKNAKVDLQAPVSGPMAGLLVFQDRNSEHQSFRISSDYTRNLIGTIYLPNGDLTIDAVNNVAEESAYTAIVVRKLRLLSSPNLVLNTDYGATTVPVPDGLGPSSGKLRLVK